MRLNKITNCSLFNKEAFIQISPGHTTGSILKNKNYRNFWERRKSNRPSIESIGFFSPNSKFKTIKVLHENLSTSIAQDIINESSEHIYEAYKGKNYHDHSVESEPNTQWDKVS